MFLELISRPLFEIGGNTITLFSLITAGIIFGGSLLFAKFVGQVVERRLRNLHLDRGVKGSIERFSRYLVIVVGSLISLDTVGVSLQSLTALGAILMVGIGFGLQNITQNFISGIIILIERPIKQGDILQVGDVEGRVSDIRVRSTILLSRDDVAMIIPNSQLVSETVVNESFSADRVRVHVRVGVAYGSDTAAVKEQLLRVAAANEHVLNNPPPLVFFENFGDSSLEFDLRVWVEELWIKDRIMSDLRFAIDAAFRKSGIEISFPQRDIHIRTLPAQGLQLSRNA